MRQQMVRDHFTPEHAREGTIAILHVGDMHLAARQAIDQPTVDRAARELAGFIWAIGQEIRITTADG